MICNRCGYIMLDSGERGYLADPPSMIKIMWYKCARCGHERSVDVELNEQDS